MDHRSETDIMELIARAPWREAVTYRDTWPHEYLYRDRRDFEIRRGDTGKRDD